MEAGVTIDWLHRYTEKMERLMERQPKDIKRLAGLAQKVEMLIVKEVFPPGDKKNAVQVISLVSV